MSEVKFIIFIGISFIPNELSSFYILISQLYLFFCKLLVHLPILGIPLFPIDSEEVF